MTTRLFVDPWDPSYGTSLGESVLEESTARLSLDLEVACGEWTAVSPPADTWRPDEVLGVDGVRRIDARVWFAVDAEPALALGVAASYAAGVVRIKGRARVAEVRVGRGIYTGCPDAPDIETPMASYPVIHTAGGEYDDQVLAVQNHMRDLELAAAFATRNSNDDLLVLDGPLRGRTSVPRTIGYIKTHQAAYLPPELSPVVVSLQPGQRTPVFTIGTTWSRHTWYLKLPVASASPWAGIVRCEVADSLSRDEVIALADSSATVLPPLASEPHKDPRAPQNLIPIGGLEKVLRHRLGDPQKLHRALCAHARGVRA